jgi:predicted amidohydrolase YtcJ
MWEMGVAVHRRAPEEHMDLVGEEATHVFLPDERIDLATAMRAFTMGSAYVNHLDDHTGSIEVGKLADLVVVDRDLFEQDILGLTEARVQLTLVDGERVFASPDLS